MALTTKKIERIGQIKAKLGDFDSKAEAACFNNAVSRGFNLVLHPEKIPYVIEHKYTPDFVLPNGVFIEFKGYFWPEDRTKHLTIKKQHPTLDIRFVFDSPFNKLNKASKTTYAMWADKHGFKWAMKTIPDDWFK